MKPFSMQAILKYRRQLEDVARQELTRAAAEEQRLTENLEERRRKLTELYAGLRGEQNQGTTVDRLLLFEHAIELAREEEEACQKKLSQQRVVVKKKRQQLLKASKDKKIMEKLREQQDAAYKRYLQGRETAMLDEIAVLSHDRKGLL